MSQPEKSKQIFVHRQEKTRRWRHGYRKIGRYKDIVAATEYSENFSESDLPAYQERQRSLVILITQAKMIIQIIFLQIYQLKW